jgi:putative peptide zinc metalloprotease protein
VQYEAQWGVNPARAAQLQAQVEREEAALARLDARIQSLNIYARSEGTLLVEQPDDLVGRYIRHGDPIGYLVGVHTPVVRVVVQQHDADRVRGQTRGVRVRLPQAFGHPLKGSLTRATPKATNELPSPVLSTMGAGDITLSPQQGDEVLALETHFEFEVAVDAPSEDLYLGSRVFVSFEHDPEPLGWRFLRAVRREFLTTLHL